MQGKDPVAFKKAWVCYISFLLTFLARIQSCGLPSYKRGWEIFARGPTRRKKKTEFEKHIVSTITAHPYPHFTDKSDFCFGHRRELRNGTQRESTKTDKFMVEPIT